MVLFGGFRYSDRGIMDWSHLRFFTASSIRRLVECEGFSVAKRHFTIVPLERVIAIPPEHPVLTVANFLLKAITSVAPGLFGYQVILVAEKRQDTKIAG